MRHIEKTLEELSTENCNLRIEKNLLLVQLAEAEEELAALKKTEEKEKENENEL
ncbi:hypothetical protein [Falseniella ignava]|uniref:hypothetical protein n=1 Tax=Falseniella ignava TaxID=137730 RepID=UPI0015DD8616|nr:hypothetical protein [Falseniella ignava]